LPEKKVYLNEGGFRLHKNIKKCIKEYHRKQKEETMIGVSQRHLKKTKAIWQLINRKIGKTDKDDYKFELKIGNTIISIPMEITENLNMYFATIVAELVKQNINNGSYRDRWRTLVSAVMNLRVP